MPLEWSILFALREREKRIATVTVKMDVDVRKGGRQAGVQL